MPIDALSGTNCGLPPPGRSPPRPRPVRCDMATRNRPRKAALAAALASTLAVGSVVSLNVPAAHAGAVPVQVWSTTPDGSDKLTRIGDASFAAGTAPAAGALGIPGGAPHPFPPGPGFGAARAQTA